VVLAPPATLADGMKIAVAPAAGAAP
jgi:hypothetical protein